MLKNAVSEKQTWYNIYARIEPNQAILHALKHKLTKLLIYLTSNLLFILYKFYFYLYKPSFWNKIID